MTSRKTKQHQPHHGRADWPAAEDELLKKLWAEGWSASQIAKSLPGRSRSAVLGRAHRIGLSRAYSKTPGRGAELKPAPRRTAAKAPPPAEPNLPKALLDVFSGPLSSFSRPWEERAVGQCAFPFDTPKGLYSCCAPVRIERRGGEEVARRYCRYHCRIVYVKPKPRRTVSRPEGLSRAA